MDVLCSTIDETSTPSPVTEIAMNQSHVRYLVNTGAGKQLDGSCIQICIKHNADGAARNCTAS